jgi:HEAT repeat protein
VVLSGLILLVGEQAFQPQQLYMIGLVAAALCAWAVWRARKAYTSALTEALRTGQPQVFYPEEEPFGGFQRDPAAQDVLLAGLSSPDAGMRRLSAEILARLPGPRAAAALQVGLGDPDPEVRLACLASLADVLSQSPGEPPPALQKVSACLSDPHADVRSQAVKTLQRIAAGDPTRLAPLQPLLADPDPSVRAQAASALLQSGQTRPALTVLEELSTHPDPPARAHALRSLGDCAACVGLSQVRRFLAEGLRDPSVAVRLAALDGLVEPPIEMADLLVRALGDEDPAVRRGAAAALGRIGEPALPAVLAALEEDRTQDGALQALEFLPTRPAENLLQAYATRKITRAVSTHALALFQPRENDAPAVLLAESLRKEALVQAFRALRAFALLHERASIDTAIQGLQSRDPLQAAYALEALEAAGDPALVRPLLPLWETTKEEPSRMDAPIQVLLDDPDPWLRACAALAVRTAGGEIDPPMKTHLAELAAGDPDDLVRAAAAAALPGGDHMQTLSTLSLMERILFLRRVPLFADLDPVDLKQVAAIGVERLYPDGATITCQGDPGNEMYIIISGMVRVQTAEGKLVVNRKPGEYVGEMAIISQAPRMFSLVASGDTRILSVGQKEFESILRQRPEVSLAVMRVLCDRLREQSG